MAKRTAEQFNAGLGRLYYATRFTVSESARHIFEDDRAHDGKCENYSRTLTDRLAGCLEQQIIDKFREDWVGGVNSVENIYHARQKASWLVGHALRVFGTSVSLTREQTILKAVIDNRIPGHYYVEDTDARTAAYRAVIATFDDVTLLVERSVVTVTISDELPRQMRAGDVVKFDAGERIMVRITEAIPTDTTGNFISLTVGDEFTLTWKLRVRSPDIPRPGGQATPGVERDIDIPNADKILTLVHYFNAVGKKRLDETVVGILLTIEASE